MTITYKTNCIGLRVPVLHRVVYARDLLTPMQQHFDRRDMLIFNWLQENCHHGFYQGPSYIREKFIEFEDDYEALMFALRWT